MTSTNGVHPCATPWCRANALPDDVFCGICAAMHHKPKPAPTEAYEATCLAGPVVSPDDEARRLRHREHNRKYYATHREAKLLADRIRREANPERVREIRLRSLEKRALFRRSAIPADVLEAALLARVSKTNDCWSWVGRFQTGWGNYGMLYIQGQCLYAHRVSYELYVGPIPSGMEIDHLCRNRHCVNPRHLEAVTHAENVRRGTSPIAEKMAAAVCKRGHPKTPENRYIRPAGGGMCLPCVRLRTVARYEHREPERAG